MEAMTSPVYYTPSESERFFRKRHTGTVAFTIGLLLFLLPFAEIRCNNMAFAKNTGLGLAIGLEWKSSVYSGLKDSMKSLADGKDDKKLDKELSSEPNLFGILAIVFALAGIIAAFTSSKYRSLLCLSAGILAAVMLIALMIQMQMDMKSQLASDKGTGDDHLGFNMSGILKLRFTTWYYTSVAAFAVAAFFGFKHHRIELDDALRTQHNFEFQRKSEEMIVDNG